LRTSDQRDGSFEIAGDVTEGKPAESERDRIVLTELRRPSRQPRGFGDLVPAIGRPAVDLAHHVAERRRATRRGEIRIKFACPCE
jgi:hypothetical protein